MFQTVYEKISIYLKGSENNALKNFTILYFEAFLKNLKNDFQI